MSGVKRYKLEEIAPQKYTWQHQHLCLSSDVERLESDYERAQQCISELEKRCEDAERTEKSYQDMLDESARLICDAINVSPEMYDRDQSDIACYGDMLSDVAKLLSAGQWQYDIDEAVFISDKDKRIAELERKKIADWLSKQSFPNGRSGKQYAARNCYYLADKIRKGEL